eukprot:4266100-Amphidinium_carterae.1
MDSDNFDQTARMGPVKLPRDNHNGAATAAIAHSCKQCKHARNHNAQYLPTISSKQLNTVLNKAINVLQSLE